MEQGAAVAGAVNGDINFFAAPDAFAASEKVVKPRFREGPYPAEDVDERLRTFVEPPSSAFGREVLRRRHVLLLLGAPRTGASTAAFALLRERCGDGGRIIGLDPSRALADLKPRDTSGYLIRALPEEAADALTDVALTALRERLENVDAHLIIVVDPTQRLSPTTARWQVRHEPPPPAEVAHAHLRAMGLSEEQLSVADAHLGDPQVKSYLETSQEPAVGTEVAEELRHIALGVRELHEALGNLTRTAADHATATLRAVRGDVAALALTTSIALLEHQDRTVIARCAAELRPLLAPTPAETPPGDREQERTRTTEADVLGDDFATRLRKVNAHPLPRVVDNGSRYWYRYWVEPVAFQRRHQADAILTRLWLDHEGIADAVLTWLRDDSTRYSPGLDYTVGLSIGRVLRHGTGPDVLRQLRPLAESPERWRRRLVAYALNEAAQDGVLAGAVRDELWEWSRLRDEHLRATVAETCAGGFGLVRPDRTLRMLDRVLNSADRPHVRKAVSSALAVLLLEVANAGRVLDAFTGWIAQPEGSGQRAYALRAVPELIDSFLQLDTDDPGPLLPLVRRSLDDAQARDAVMGVLLSAEHSPNAGTRLRATALITLLAATAGGQRGVRALLIARVRRDAQSDKLTEGTVA
ncbi:hypothetical protein DEH69_05015 [Streptomyces sp. PT12]|nr:hypothetical protein DEH69_05015 [Streptomyces sp. PT12]